MLGSAYTEHQSMLRQLDDTGDTGLIENNRVFTARKRSLGQGNIFIGVCQEFCSQGACFHPGGVLPPRGGLSPGRGASSQGGAWWRPPGTATAACGMHPTGMHSCYDVLIRI